MIIFFKTNSEKIIAVQFDGEMNESDLPKLNWLLAGEQLNDSEVSGVFIGPRAAMVSPWSTNAVEITQNMAIENIVRIEEYIIAKSKDDTFDPMLANMFTSLTQSLFDVGKKWPWWEEGRWWKMDDTILKRAVDEARFGPRSTCYG